jgi:hypothetical protein
LSKSWFFSENEELEERERERESDLGEIRKWRDLKDDFSTFLISQKKKKKPIQIDLKEGKRTNKRVCRGPTLPSLFSFSP